MKDDIETLREFINVGDDLCGFKRAKALAALERVSFDFNLLQDAFVIATKRANSTEAERDSLRAKLGKATKALQASLEDIVITIAFIGRDKGSERLPETLEKLCTGLVRRDNAIRAVLSELSADAPTPRAVRQIQRRPFIIADDSDAPAQQEPDRHLTPDEQKVFHSALRRSSSDAPAPQSQSFSQLCDDKDAVEEFLRNKRSAPAQPPQVSDEAAKKIIRIYEEFKPKIGDVSALRAAIAAALEGRK